MKNRGLIIVASVIIGGVLASSCSQDSRNPVAPSSAPIGAKVRGWHEPKVDVTGGWGVRAQKTYAHTFWLGGVEVTETKSRSETSNPCSYWHSHTTSTGDPVNGWVCSGGGQQGGGPGGGPDGGGAELEGSTIAILD